MGRPKPEEPLATWTLRLPVSFASAVDEAAREEKLKRPDFLRKVLREMLDARSSSTREVSDASSNQGSHEASHGPSEQVQDHASSHGTSPF